MEGLALDAQQQHYNAPNTNNMDSIMECTHDIIINMQRYKMSSNKRKKEASKLTVWAIWKANTYQDVVTATCLLAF